MGGHEYLADFAVRLATLIADGLRALIASRLDATLFGKITGLDFTAAFCVLLAMFLFAGTVKFFLSRKAKQAQHDAKEVKNNFIRLSDRPI
jgi:hypothetical protein